MKCQKQRSWLQWPHYCYKDPSVDSKFDEVLNNWLFHKLNAECFSRISTTYYFIGIGVSAKLWATHLQFWLSRKTKRSGRQRQLSWKLKSMVCHQLLQNWTAVKFLPGSLHLMSKLLILVLLRRCYLFMAIKQQNFICLVAFNGNFHSR